MFNLKFTLRLVLRFFRLILNQLSWFKLDFEFDVSVEVKVEFEF